jgi:hypothetical protein
MKSTPLVLVAWAFSFIGAAVTGIGACSASVAGLPLPSDDKPFAWPTPQYVPTTCSVNDYVAVTDLDGCDCGTDTSYALCDGPNLVNGGSGTYTQCSCALPVGWTAVTYKRAGAIVDGGSAPDGRHD